VSGVDAYSVIRWAREQAPAGLNRGQAHVLLLLATYADAATGKCYPGLKSLAEDASVSSKSVERDIAALSRMGLVVSRRRQGRSAVRYLCVPWSPHLSDGTSASHPETVTGEVVGDVSVPSGSVWDASVLPEGTPASPRMGHQRPPEVPGKTTEDSSKKEVVVACAPAREPATTPNLSAFLDEHPPTHAHTYPDARRIAGDHFDGSTSAVAAVMHYGDDHDLVTGYLAADALDQERNTA
jgi:hypothetical protein